MAKLDKLQFARVIAYCVSNGMSAYGFEVNTLDDMIDIDVPEVQPAKVIEADVQNLMMSMVEGIDKIKAIKAYRSLTGAYLKEAKDAVEKYWVNRVVSREFDDNM